MLGRVQVIGLRFAACCGREKAHELIADERGGLFGGPLTAVHAQYVESGLDEPFGRLPVEMGLGMAAAWRQLEAVVRAAGGEPLGDGVRVGFQDHGEVGPVSLGVDLPQEGRVDAVKALHDQGGRDVPVADDCLPAFGVRADLGLQVMVAVRCVQAGQGVTGQ